MCRRNHLPFLLLTHNKIHRENLLQSRIGSVGNPKANYDDIFAARWSFEGRKAPLAFGHLTAKLSRMTVDEDNLRTLSPTNYRSHVSFSRNRREY